MHLARHVLSTTLKHNVDSSPNPSPHNWHSRCCLGQRTHLPLATSQVKQSPHSEGHRSHTRAPPPSTHSCSHPPRLGGKPVLTRTQGNLTVGRTVLRVSRDRRKPLTPAVKSQQHLINRQLYPRSNRPQALWRQRQPDMTQERLQPYRPQLLTKHARGDAQQRHSPQGFSCQRVRHRQGSDPIPQRNRPGWTSASPCQGSDAKLTQQQLAEDSCADCPPNAATTPTWAPEWDRIGETKDSKKERRNE